MKSLGYWLFTLLGGVLVQFVCERYLSHVGAAPQVLLLMTIAHGFLIGPVTAETMGFFWGIMLDAAGVTYFGMNALLLAVAGFIAGSLRKRVASERPSAQLAVGALASIYMVVGGVFIRSLLEEVVYYPSVWNLLATLVFNVLAVTAVFWVLEWWLAVWTVNRESI